jgi:hypothetical protein
MFSKNYLKTWLAAACVIETLCATYFLDFTYYATFFSFTYFIAGISIGIMILFFPQIKRNVVANERKYNREFFFKIILIAATGFFLFYESKSIMLENPLDYRTADMLPVIKIMNERFLHGEWKHVYDSIPGIWSESKPIYLPCMWLPFSPAVALNHDVRWITVAALFIVFFILITKSSFKKNWKCFLLLLTTALIILWWLISADDQHGFISLTEEGVIVLFYVLLALALISENILLISIATCLCMLSRYSGIGFVPAFFIYLLLSKKKKQAVSFALMGLMFAVVFFIIPFGWTPFIDLLKLPGNYIHFSKIVWRDTPEIFAGLGFARFFIPEKINALHSLLIALSFIIPLGVVGFWYAFRKKINLNNVPLATLKISLVVFYNFIDVPYLYLFYTSSFVSLVIALSYLRSER